MAITVDARGLACPQPVILAKRAMENNQEINVLVDNDAAVENIRRLAAKMVYRFSVTEKAGSGGVREISLVQSETTVQISIDEAALAAEMTCSASSGPGPLVVVLSDNHMGRGDDVLGDILIRSFIHTLTQINPLPEKIICYNSGVKLTVKDSSVIDDLQSLGKKGVDILVCGTCVNYFGIGDQIGAGHISNMYDIAETMAAAGRLIRP